MDAPSFLEVAHLPVGELPDVVHVPPLTRPFDVTITPPGSKSLTNRALLLAALAEGESTLTNALVDADDTRVMITALRQLGATIEADPVTPTTLRIRGVNGRWRVPPEGVTLHLENAGTAVRFLTAAAMLAAPGSGPITIDGSPRMRERPIGELLAVLRSLGTKVECSGSPESLPIRVCPPDQHWPASTSVEFGRTASSQFISAMLLVSPFFPNGLTVRVSVIPTSPTYIYMTSRLMSSLGVRFAPRPSHSNSTQLDRDTRMISIAPPQRMRAFMYTIESDASSASYFLAASALLPSSRVRVDGVPGQIEESLQGDIEFQGVLDAMGLIPTADSTSIEMHGPSLGRLLKPFDWDFTNTPDAAMSAAVLACFASPTDHNPTATSTLRGLRTLRVKESDRLAALQTELSKLGAAVEILTTKDDEALRVTPPRRLPNPTAPLIFDTYNDHRMAMSLALIGLRVPNVCIRNPACVAKTYPTFWQDLARLYASSSSTRA